MSEFFEAIWHGEGIGDGADPGGSSSGLCVVKPEDGDWVEAVPLTGLIR